MNAFNTIKKKFRSMPTLETERLILRMIELSDYEELFHYSAQKEVVQYVLWDTFVNPREAKEYIECLRALIHKYKYYEWAVILKDTGKMIGTCGFTSFSHFKMSAEVGFSFNSHYWRNGYGHESVQKVLEFAQNELGLEFVFADTVEENIRCRNLLHNLQFEKTSKGYYMYFKGKTHHILRYKKDLTIS